MYFKSNYCSGIMKWRNLMSSVYLTSWNSPVSTEGQAGTGRVTCSGIWAFPFSNAWIMLKAIGTVALWFKKMSTLDILNTCSTVGWQYPSLTSDSWPILFLVQTYFRFLSFQQLLRILFIGAMLWYLGNLPRTRHLPIWCPINDSLLNEYH